MLTDIITSTNIIYLFFRFFVFFFPLFSAIAFCKLKEDKKQQEK